jgi:hypothetical protein
MRRLVEPPTWTMVFPAAWGAASAHYGLDLWWATAVGMGAGLIHFIAYNLLRKREE